MQQNTQKSDQQQFLHQLLDMAEVMLECGAEIHRIEDTLTRMGLAYGAAQMNVFVITSSVVATMEMPDGAAKTLTRRIQSNGGTDFHKLEQLNALSRSYCSSPLPNAELAKAVDRIRNDRSGQAVVYIGNALAAGGFSLFFGGSLWDGIAAAVFGLFICLVQNIVSGRCPNKMVINLICSFLSGVGICLSASLIPILQADKVIIGDIMLLIPGIAITNAVRDILMKDTIAGSVRLIESLLWAVALACGFMAAIWLMGGY